MPSSFVLNGNILSFSVESNPQTLLRIDPYVKWATYYGGFQDDIVYDCVSDSLDNLYTIGRTLSNNNIASPGAHQTSSYGNAFLVKFDSSGTRKWGTYYGGNYDDYGLSCAVDSEGMVYFTGWTGSANAVASGGHQNTFGGDHDAMIVKFDTAGYANGALTMEEVSTTTDMVLP